VDDLRRRVALVAGDADAALAAYRKELGDDASTADLESAVMSDVVFRMPAVRLADAQVPNAPVWQYLFSWRSPAWGGQMGACHALEIPFVFDLVADQRLHVFVGPDAPAELARVMHDAWVAFAVEGKPAADDLPDWPALGGDGRPVLVLDEDCVLADDPNGTTRAFWLSRPRVLD
jgi:para-nitrobenzyl esterase